VSLGGGEILVVMFVALIVFGPSRLPEIARQVGKALAEVRKMQDSVRREIRGALDTDEHEPSYAEPQLPPESIPGGAPGLPSADPDQPSTGSFS
jgi:Tat protein translocase TatB subunit